VRLPIAMAAVYVPTPRFGDDSLTDFHHGLLEVVRGPTTPDAGCGVGDDGDDQGGCPPVYSC
jgi:hypothetical protein